MEFTFPTVTPPHKLMLDTTDQPRAPRSTSTRTNRSSKPKICITPEFRKIRIEKGLTQRDLAKAIEVSEPFISLIETGESHPSAPTAAKIAETLKEPFEKLFFIQEEPK